MECLSGLEFKWVYNRSVKYPYNLYYFRKAQDASANRYIMDIDCGKPFEREGVEWIIIKIKGEDELYLLGY